MTDISIRQNVRTIPHGKENRLRKQIVHRLQSLSCLLFGITTISRRS